MAPVAAEPMKSIVEIVVEVNRFDKIKVTKFLKFKLQPKIEEEAPPAQPELVEEKPKKAYIKNGRRKPKRNESTLSRFSSIFNNGRNLTDVLVEEFRLNDRFSGELLITNYFCRYLRKHLVHILTYRCVLPQLDVTKFH